MIELDSAVEPIIREHPGDLETIYHLAMGGTQISYDGLTGRPLALQAAYDLELCGHPQAGEWVDQILLETSDREITQPNPQAAHRFAGLVANFELYKHGHVDGIRRLTNSFDRIVTHAELSTPITPEPVQHLTQLDYLLAAAITLNHEGLDTTPHLDELYTTLTKAWQVALLLHPTMAPQARDMVTSVLGEFQQIDGLERRVPTHLWRRLARLRNYPNTYVRATALHAAADLREQYPHKRSYRRLARRAARSASLYFAFSSKTSQAEHNAMRRVSRGTVFDEDLWFRTAALMSTVQAPLVATRQKFLG